MRIISIWAIRNYDTRFLDKMWYNLVIPVFFQEESIYEVRRPPCSISTNCISWELHIILTPRWSRQKPNHFKRRGGWGFAPRPWKMKTICDVSSGFLSSFSGAPVISERRRPPQASARRRRFVGPIGNGVYQGKGIGCMTLQKINVSLLKIQTSRFSIFWKSKSVIPLYNLVLNDINRPKIMSWVSP